MLTSKQRAQLRGLAMNLDTTLHIGKNGITDTLVATVGDALEAHELIKLRVLETCDLGVRGAAEELAEATGAEVVSVIGTKCILYRESETKKKIEL